MKLTSQNIHECTTPNGGWNKAQLAVLGITWPPEKGWIRRLDGKEITEEEFSEVKRLSTLHHKENKSTPKANLVSDRSQTLIEARDAAKHLAALLTRLIEQEKS